MSFWCCVFSNDDCNDCKIDHFFKLFIIFKHVMSFYFKNENNEYVVSMKMIMRRIKMKFFINKNAVCNDVDHKIKHVIYISKIHIHVFCKRVNVDIHSIVNQNKKWFHFWHQHEFVCTISFFDKALFHCFVDDVNVEIMIQNSWRTKKVIENEIDCEKLNDIVCLYDDKNFYWFFFFKQNDCFCCLFRNENSCECEWSFFLFSFTTNVELNVVDFFFRIFFMRMWWRKISMNKRSFVSWSIIFFNWSS